MSAEDEPRVWAKRDRTIVPPQRRLARAMRAAPTEAERKLWWHLRHRLLTPGTHFRRQVRIGRYVADFACHATRIVVEVDGGQPGARAPTPPGHSPEVIEPIRVRHSWLILAR